MLRFEQGFQIGFAGNDMVGAQLVHRLSFRAPCHGNYFRATPFGQLYGGRANTSRGASDQHPLA